MDELGYLFFRGLLPAEELWRLRRRFLDVLNAHGWLAPNAPVENGIVDHAVFSRVPQQEIDFCGVGVTAAAYRQIHHIEEFHRLAHHPNLIGAYSTL